MTTLKDEIEAIKRLQDGIVKNKVANFAYTDEAYTKNNADGVEIYDINQSQNIPVPDPDVLKVNPTVLTKGYRAQASSVTRMLMNHFFGRTSYNLNKVNDFFLSLLTKLSAYLGKANGIATLDSNVKVPVEQLQNIIDDNPVDVTTTTNKTYSISKIREIVTQQAEELSNSIREVLEQLNSFINTKGKANGIATLDSNSRVPLSQLQNITDTKGKANGIATLDSNSRVPLSQLQNITDTKGKANGIATLDSNTRVPVEQLQNITDTKGKANGIATLDSNTRVPVEQLQNIIYDASARGNKTYSSNKIDAMNTNLNNKIDLLKSNKIYANYITIEFYYPAKNMCVVFCNLITPFKISNFDDFYDYLSQNSLHISANGKYMVSDNEFASIYIFSCGLLTNREISVQYINSNGKEGLLNVPISYLKRFSSVSKELL